MPRVDWRGIRGAVTTVSPARDSGGCKVYDLRIEPRPFECKADFIAGDVHGTVGAEAKEAQLVTLQLPAQMKPPTKVGDEVCAMYDWVDEGPHRIWDSALVARDGRLLMLAVENGALEVGGIRTKTGITATVDLEMEHLRVVAQYPGGEIELMPWTAVTRSLGGAKYHLLADAFRRRVEVPEHRSQGFFFAAVLAR
ncbi:MAG: hypothetical protein R3B13_14185 [Polyangiaceae bacterium]